MIDMRWCPPGVADSSEVFETTREIFDKMAAAKSRISAAAKLARIEALSLARPLLRKDFVSEAKVKLSHPSEKLALPSWALVGCEDWLRAAVPAVRAAGHNVVAVSVKQPRSGCGDAIRDMLRLQDMQDKVVSDLGVPFGLATSKLASHIDVEGVVGESRLAGSTIAEEILKQGKLFLAAPTTDQLIRGADLKPLLQV